MENLLEKSKLIGPRCIFGSPDPLETQQFLIDADNYDRICLENNYILFNDGDVDGHDDNHRNGKENSFKLNRPKNRNKCCLFGKPAIEEIDELVENQQNYDYQRIKELYGFDLLEIERFETIRMRTILKKTKKKRATFLRRNSTKRKRLFPDNINPTITDFYQENKRLTATTEK